MQEGWRQDGRVLTHLDDDGRARMVDVGNKPETVRFATARAVLVMRPETLLRVRAGGVQKGDVLAIAQVAGIMAAKRTPELIPLCHPIALSGVDVHFSYPDERSISIDVTVRTTARTGVEMEALTAATTAAWTVYDMCKAIDKDMSLIFAGLMEKQGGRSGHYQRAADREEPS